MKHNFIPRLIS